MKVLMKHLYAMAFLAAALHAAAQQSGPRRTTSTPSQSPASSSRLDTEQKPIRLYCTGNNWTTGESEILIDVKNGSLDHFKEGIKDNCVTKIAVTEAEYRVTQKCTDPSNPGWGFQETETISRVTGHLVHSVWVTGDRTWSSYTATCEDVSSKPKLF